MKAKRAGKVVQRDASRRQHLQTRILLLLLLVLAQRRPLFRELTVGLQKPKTVNRRNLATTLQQTQKGQSPQ